MKRKASGELIAPQRNGLLNLPTEVLDLIFKDLPLLSKINLAKAHPYFGKAFTWHCRKKYQSIYLVRLPYKVWLPILVFCGHTVRHASFFELDDRKLKLLRVFCSNLEVLMMDLRRDHIERAKMLLLSSKRLRELAFTAQRENVAELMQVLPRIPSLRHLNIFRFFDTQSK